MKQKRCVIIGGAAIGDYDYVKNFLGPDDFYIFCDSGLRHMQQLGVAPDLIVGDFDSCDDPELPVETIVLPCEKDDTDTFYAAKEGVLRGCENFLLLGVIGGRLDHSLGNISILLYLDSLGKQAWAVDDHSWMEIVSDRPATVADSFSYFSLLNISGTAEGVTVENAKYCLEDGVITCDYAYGISNQVLPGKTASVRVEKGRLLLIRIR